MPWTIYESPFGPLTLVAGRAGLREVHFPERKPRLEPVDHDPDALRDVCEQLEQYFAGERKACHDQCLRTRAALREPAVGDELVGAKLCHPSPMTAISVCRNPTAFGRKAYSHQ